MIERPSQPDPVTVEHPVGACDAARGRTLRTSVRTAGDGVSGDPVATSHDAQTLWLARPAGDCTGNGRIIVVVSTGGFPAVNPKKYRRITVP